MSEPAQTQRPATAWDGVKTVLPLLPGIFPFGMIAGSSAIEAGITVVPALALSVLVFAGASQLVFIELWDRGAPAVVLLATVLLVNLRFAMYSATLAPFLHRGKLYAKALAAYVMTDQAALLSVPVFERQGLSGRRFYLGAAFTLWTTWQVGTAIGIFLGATVPPSWSLDFAVPLSFLALLIPAVNSRPALVAAVTAGGLILVTRFLPLNLGLIVASLAGVAAGMLAERRKSGAPAET